MWIWKGVDSPTILYPQFNFTTCDSFEKYLSEKGIMSQTFHFFPHHPAG